MIFIPSIISMKDSATQREGKSGFETRIWARIWEWNMHIRAL